MPEQQFKRNIAYKFRIGDILIGKPVFDEEKFTFLELGDKKIVRINIIGNIVDKYDSEGEKRYSFLTLDDGSGQIKLKAFGDDIEKSKNINQGETVIVIGVLRYFNNELYISPEIIKEQNPKYLLVRKLELEKERIEKSPPMEKQQIVAIKDKILDLVKNSESEGGIDTDKIIMDLKETSPEIINQEIKKLIEDGIIFEPRPGKVRWLG
ncbi:MAG: OB-fold nucleic acid binding domain-containing protein [Candidatus Pacearchaeota archaeon]|jgi:RPA family protein|nr:hypothetical protein [Candidatus Pacearchaeota archaeon]MDP7520655.1 OB-fold nucleic acid binding domain-containing protein [Candidatus Pacearchaeota archaeon]|tara:strand:- start:8521 stop:9147 length:627 start_codon:yes stop_codon:yes gene_type:complete